MPQILTDENLVRYVNTDHVIHYINQIFKNAIDVDPAWMVEIRKIGQYRMDSGATEPAEQSIPAQLLQFDNYNWLPGLAQWVAQRVLTTAPVGIGAFMAPALLNDRRATDASVVRMLSVCADFDTGNPAQQLKSLSDRLGMRPTIVATSGGITGDGHAKLHAHWRLDEPCDEPWKVAYVREQLAKQFGADQSFKRIPQIIRIPGALYDKNGQWSTTLITEFNDHDIGLMRWEEFLNIDWNNLCEDSVFSQRNANKSKEERLERIHQIQTQEVEAGRSDDTRYDRFSAYAGHQIRQARFKHQSVEEALESVQLWVRDKMIPPWDGQKIDTEFKALLGKDKVANADQWAQRDMPPIVFGNAPVPVNVVAVPDTHVQGEDQPWLMTFNAASLYSGDAPKERHLIDNFLVHQSSVALVADGGVGKTYLAIELALRAAAGPVVMNGQSNNFMGFEVLERMNVILLTVEDGQHDIHRRICAIDPDGSLRVMSDQHCFIVPVQEQILNGLTLSEKDSKGNYAPSAAWRAVVEHIERLLKYGQARQGYPLLVIIDTYSATHHGDENSAMGTNEWFRAAGMLRKHEATLLLTHHTRKADPTQEIRTPSDMKAAVRGSSAFINANRTVVGVWEMPNSDAVLGEMHREEKGTRLFNMGILKNNTGISWDDRSDPRYPEPMITLRRLGTGRLVYDALIHNKRIDLANGKQERMEASRAQLRAAIVHRVRWNAEHAWPLSERNILKDKEQFLPPKIMDMSRDKEIKPALQELLASGAIVQIAVKGRNAGGGMIFDVPEGPYAKGVQSGRRDNVPIMHWSHYTYDAQNECYNEIENLQHVIDL